MLNELKQTQQTISMEAAASDPEALRQTAFRLPAFLDQASEFLSKTILRMLGDYLGLKNLGWLALQAQRRPYSEMRGFPAAAPQGFKGSLVEYGKALVISVDELDDLCKDVLDPFGAWVSARIADPESLKSLTNTLKIPGLQPPKLEAAQKRLDRFFPDKTNEKQPVYGELFQRQGDWADLNNIVKKLNTYYANGKYEKVQQKLPELSELMRVLSARISEDKTSEVFQFSQVTIEQLSKVTVQVAELVEFYGVLRHRTDEFIKCVADNVDLVKENI